MPSIYTKLLAVQTKLKAPKSQFNSFGNYKYRNCEDILEALKPHLKEENATLYIEDSVEQVADRVYVKAIVHFIDCESGEKMQTSAYAREAMTKKGLDDAQLTGATSSYARKYALNALFAIDDTKDFDSMDNTTKEEKPRSEPKKGDKTQNKQSKTARQELLEYCKEKGLDAVAISKQYALDHKTTEERFAEVLNEVKNG